MLKKIRKFADAAETSVDFTSTYEPGSPVDLETINSLKEAFEDLGCAISNSLLGYYHMSNGFKLNWSYDKVTNPDYLTWGSTNIVEIEILLSLTRYLPDEPILFDYISDQNQVMLKMIHKNVALLYHDEYLQRAFPLRIDIDDYFHLLDESRALYPWQEILIKDKLFEMEPALKKKFFEDLDLLFNDVETKVFLPRVR